MDRIAKKIAAYGYCSRRDAEVLIFAGRVKVNGQITANPAVKISDSDIIEIDGRVINSKIIPKIFLYHKPVGVITTARDPQGRTTVFERIAKDYPKLLREEVGRLIYVGRLDINSSGLLLLTNVPAIANYLERGNFLRVYKVRISGKLSDTQIAKILAGIVIDGIKYSGVQSVKNVADGDDIARSLCDKNVGKNHWIEIALTEGKNREIRKIMESFGLSVSKLIRIKYHNFSLGNLAVGKLVEADKKSVSEMVREIK